VNSVTTRLPLAASVWDVRASGSRSADESSALRGRRTVRCRGDGDRRTLGWSLPADRTHSGSLLGPV